MKAILMDGTVIEGVGGLVSDDHGVVLRDGQGNRSSQMGHIPKEHLWAVVPDDVDTEPPKDSGGTATLGSPGATEPHS